MTTIPQRFAQRRWVTFVQSLFFLAGFATFVVLVMGAATTVLGSLLFDLRPYIQVVGGLSLVLFGCMMLGVRLFGWFYTDTRFALHRLRPPKSVSRFHAFVTGLTFAAGWTPCIGPFLGAILSLGIGQEQLLTRLALLLAYVVGLGIPFLLFALFFDTLYPLFNRIKRHLRWVEIFSGVLLIVVGLVIVTGQMSQLSQALANQTSELETLILGEASDAPSFVVAMLAGLLSFASPCVLPLLPAYLGVLGGWGVQNLAQEETN